MAWLKGLWSGLLCQHWVCRSQVYGYAEDAVQPIIRHLNHRAKASSRYNQATGNRPSKHIVFAVCRGQMSTTVLVGNRGSEPQDRRIARKEQRSNLPSARFLASPWLASVPTSLSSHDMARPSWQTGKMMSHRPILPLVHVAKTGKTQVNNSNKRTSVKIPIKRMRCSPLQQLKKPDCGTPPWLELKTLWQSNFQLLDIKG